MSTVNSKSLTYFPTWMPLIFLSCQIAMTSTTNAVLILTVDSNVSQKKFHFAICILENSIKVAIHIATLVFSCYSIRNLTFYSLLNLEKTENLHECSCSRYINEHWQNHYFSVPQIRIN